MLSCSHDPRTPAVTITVAVTMTVTVTVRLSELLHRASQMTTTRVHSARRLHALPQSRGPWNRELERYPWRSWGSPTPQRTRFPRHRSERPRASRNPTPPPRTTVYVPPPRMMAKALPRASARGPDPRRTRGRSGRSGTATRTSEHRPERPHASRNPTPHAHGRRFQLIIDARRAPPRTSHD